MLCSQRMLFVAVPGPLRQTVDVAESGGVMSTRRNSQQIAVVAWRCDFAVAEPTVGAAAVVAPVVNSCAGANPCRDRYQIVGSTSARSARAQRRWTGRHAHRRR